MAKKTNEQKAMDYIVKFKKNLWKGRVIEYLKENQKDLYWGAVDINFYGDTIDSFSISEIFPKEEGKLLDAYILPVEWAHKDFYKKDGFISFHIYDPAPYDKKETWECYFSKCYHDSRCLDETPYKYLDNNPDWEYHDEDTYRGEYYYVGKSYERTINIPIEEILKNEDDTLAHQSLKEKHPEWI